MSPPLAGTRSFSILLHWRSHVLWPRETRGPSPRGGLIALLEAARASLLPRLNPHYCPRPATQPCTDRRRYSPGAARTKNTSAAEIKQRPKSRKQTKTQEYSPCTPNRSISCFCCHHCCCRKSAQLTSIPSSSCGVKAWMLPSGPGRPHTFCNWRSGFPPFRSGGVVGICGQGGGGGWCRR